MTNTDLSYIERFKTAMEKSDVEERPLETRSVSEGYDVIIASTIHELIARVEALEAALERQP